MASLYCLSYFYVTTVYVIFMLLRNSQHWSNLVARRWQLYDKTFGGLTCLEVAMTKKVYLGDALLHVGIALGKRLND